MRSQFVVSTAAGATTSSVSCCVWPASQPDQPGRLKSASMRTCVPGEIRMRGQTVPSFRTATGTAVPFGVCADTVTPFPKLGVLMRASASGSESSPPLGQAKRPSASAASTRTPIPSTIHGQRRRRRRRAAPARVRAHARDLVGRSTPLLHLHPDMVQAQPAVGNFLPVPAASDSATACSRLTYRRPRDHEAAAAIRQATIAKLNASCRPELERLG